jgi:hypothetical protein
MTAVYRFDVVVITSEDVVPESAAYGDPYF